MSKTRSIVALLLAVCLVAAVLCGCTVPEEQKGDTAQTTTTTKAPAVMVKAAVLKGPTAIGMLHLMDKAQKKTARGNYKFDVYAAPDQVTAALIKGELDVAALPTNAGSTLYNKTQGKIQIAAVNTLGVLYLLENTAASDAPAVEATTKLDYLKGQTVSISGKGATPQYVLDYLMNKNGLKAEDVTLDWQTEHAGVMANLVAGKVRYAVLPQPFATNAQTKSANVKVVTDLNKAWKEVSGEDELVMGCLLVRKEFAEQNPEAVQTLLEEYAQSAAFAINQVEETAGLCGSFGIMDAEVAKKAIPHCGVTYIAGAEMKRMVSGYLDVLLQSDPTSVGGALPKEDFYYGA